MIHSGKVRISCVPKTVRSSSFFICFFILSRRQDSNLRLHLQRVTCCPYTTAHWIHLSRWSSPLMSSQLRSLCRFVALRLFAVAGLSLRVLPTTRRFGYYRPTRYSFCPCGLGRFCQSTKPLTSAGGYRCGVGRIRTCTAAFRGASSATCVARPLSAHLFVCVYHSATTPFAGLSRPSSCCEPHGGQRGIQ